MNFFSISLIIIVLNFIVSYKGFKDALFFEKYSFRIDAVTIQKDYKRLITSGFLHVNWMHLIFNMLSLYFFSDALEGFIGSTYYLIIYMSGLIGGNLLSILIHKHHSGYSSVGASGAIFAIIFSAIALFPGMSIGLFFIPIPGWLFGLAFVLFSIYGIHSPKGNIGYDAHLGGGLTGMLVAILMFPSALVNNALTILIVAVPAIVFILFILYKPEALLINDYFFRSRRTYTVEDRYNVSKLNKQKELDRLLEKIHNKGINSLSKKEREMLKEYSK